MQNNDRDELEKDALGTVEVETQESETQESEIEETEEQETEEQEPETEAFEEEPTQQSETSTGRPTPRRRLVGVEDKKVETKRIIIFLVVTFGLCWLVELFIIRPMYMSGDTDVVTQAVSMIGSMMFAPAFGAIVARLMTQEGLLHSGFQFNFSQHKFCFLFGWFGPTVLIFLGAALYFVIFQDNFDPGMSVFVNAYDGTKEDAIQIVAAFKTDLLVKVFTAPVLNIINSFGEQWGFQAYLLPKLYRKLGTVKAILLTGLASGLWYAPLVLLGYFYGNDYAGFPITGIAAMCVFGMVTGIIYSSLSLITGSIFPAVFAHSALNVMMSQAGYFCFDGGNHFVGPQPTGVISGIPFIIAAVLFMMYMIKNPAKPSSEQA